MVFRQTGDAFYEFAPFAVSNTHQRRHTFVRKQNLCAHSFFHSLSYLRGSRCAACPHSDKEHSDHPCEGLLRKGEQNGKQTVPPILFYPSSVSRSLRIAVAIARLARRLAVRASPLRRESARSRAWIPPALLPVGHSPSRRSRLRRWRAFTPPVRSGPTCVGGLVFCCSCRQPPLTPPLLITGEVGWGCPHLLFREATASFDYAQDRESGSSSRAWQQARATDRLLAC